MRPRQYSRSRPQTSGPRRFRGCGRSPSASTTRCKRLPFWACNGRNFTKTASTCPIARVQKYYFFRCFPRPRWAKSGRGGVPFPSAPSGRVLPMAPFLFGAITPSFRSVLSLALMPLGLLLACALVAGVGAMILLFSRATARVQTPEPIAISQEATAGRAPETQRANPATSPRSDTATAERRRADSEPFTERLDAATAPGSSGGAAATQFSNADSLALIAAKDVAAGAAQFSAARTGPRAHKSQRPGAPSQPAGRFSRSQQAFLRIPVVLSGRCGAESEFREETCTLILLPQGAVLPLSRRLPAGTATMLCLPGKEPVPCSVFAAQTGPDGRSLVEVEFAEPQKDFWPVSFPAWDGQLPADLERRGSLTPRRPAHTAVLNEAGS